MRVDATAAAGRNAVGAALHGPLPGYLALYAALYCAYGTQSPFFPAFLGGRGLSAEEIGFVLGYGTAVKLVAAPLAGRLADRLGSGRVVLAAFAAATGLLGFGYFAASGLWAVVAVLTAWSIAIAPLAPLADTLALDASEGGGVFPYGWVRGMGSAAFIAGTSLAGPTVDHLGLGSTIVLSGVLFVATAIAAMRVASRPTAPSPDRGSVAAAASTLLGLPAYRWLLVVAALVMGSHALNDSFGVIRWRAAGLSGATIGFVWSAAVVSEVAVFFLLGPILLKRVGPAGGAAIAAVAGVLRWAAMALTTAIPVLVAAQLLHGFTFALLHLSAMALIGRVVPPHLAATGQTLYGAVAVGVANVVVTFASGPLYGYAGAAGFWVMAALCLLALPFTRGLRATPPEDPARGPGVPANGH